MKDIGKWRNGWILQVMEEGEMMLPYLPLWHTANSQGPLPLLPHLKIDFLQIGAVLDQDLHL